MAEDLISEVFLDVWRQADRFEGRSAVSTWLMSIARFKALSARRGRKDAELDDKIEATIADPADDPAVTLEKKNQSELLRHALTKLSANIGRLSTSFTIMSSRLTKQRRSSASQPPP
jgi:RNA polymerase sigma-70 factor (ECF subfamily)